MPLPAYMKWLKKKDSKPIHEKKTRKSVSLLDGNLDAVTGVDNRKLGRTFLENARMD